MNNTCVSLAVHTIGLPFPTDGPPAATVWHHRLTAESDTKQKKAKMKKKKMALEESDELRGAASTAKTSSRESRVRTLRKESPKKIESARWRWMLLAAVVPDTLQTDRLLLNSVFCCCCFLGIMI